MKHADAVESTLFDGSLQLTWLAHLTADQTPHEVAAVIAGLVQARSGCHAACVLWGLEQPATHNSVPPTLIDPADWLAEGIETQAKRSALMAKGSELGQG